MPPAKYKNFQTTLTRMSTHRLLYLSSHTRVQTEHRGDNSTTSLFAIDSVSLQAVFQGYYRSLQLSIRRHHQDLPTRRPLSFVNIEKRVLINTALLGRTPLTIRLKM